METKEIVSLLFWSAIIIGIALSGFWGNTNFADIIMLAFFILVALFYPKGKEVKQ